MKESWGFLDVKLDELMMLVDTCVRKKGGGGGCIRCLLIVSLLSSVIRIQVQAS